MSNIDLAKYLTEWFKRTDFKDKNIWNRCPVGAVIKEQIKKSGHWKNKPKNYLDF